MIEDLGLVEPHMNEAVPNMGTIRFGLTSAFDGTGSVVAALDTGVRGDHEGLNDMDDEPFTTGCEQPDPDPEPNPIFVDCDPKIVAFYDAVLMDAEQDPSTSYDSGTHMQSRSRYCGRYRRGVANRSYHRAKVCRSGTRSVSNQHLSYAATGDIEDGYPRGSVGYRE